MHLNLDVCNVGTWDDRGSAVPFKSTCRIVPWRGAWPVSWLMSEPARKGDMMQRLIRIKGIQRFAMFLTLITSAISICFQGCSSAGDVTKDGISACYNWIRLGWIWIQLARGCLTVHEVWLFPYAKLHFEVTYYEATLLDLFRRRRFSA
jgi:hypothetical protein